jgi:hypothetical protein
MIDLFSEIQKRLSEIKELNFIDFDCQQIEKQDTSYPVVCPAVLINYDSTWEGSDVQNGAVKIDLRIYFSIYEDTHQTAEDRFDAFKQLGLLNVIHQKLQGFRGTNFGKLVRTSSGREARADQYTCFVLSYKTTYTDYSAEKVYDYVQATPSIEVEIVKK